MVSGALIVTAQILEGQKRGYGTAIVVLLVVGAGLVAATASILLVQRRSTQDDAQGDGEERG